MSGGKVISPQKDTPIVGMVLDGRYKIIRELGRGGMGIVFEARHTGIGRRLAIKVLHGEFASVPAVLQRFRREAKITGSLGHPNIIQVTDTGTMPNGAPYLVMELLQGESLSSVLRKSPTLSAHQSIEIMAPVLRALSAVHANGIIHRDLKPENIFLAEGLGTTQETVVKVLDFGISKPVDTKFEGSTLTATGTFLGTPYYMSPEHMRGKDIDHRTDIYACGVILYQMLTGQAPFKADSLCDLLVAILTETPTSVRTLCPELPETLAQVVHRAMARDKEERFASADEFLGALDTIFSPAVVPEATVQQKEVAEDAGKGKIIPTLNIDSEFKILEDETTRDFKVSGPRRWGLLVGIAVAVTAVITLSILLAVGSVSSSDGSASDLPVVQDISPDAAPITAGSLAPRVTTAVEPDSSVSQVKATPKKASTDVEVDGRMAPSAQNAPEPPPLEKQRATSSPRQRSSFERRPSSSSPSEIPTRRPSTETSRQRIVTDIDVRLPPNSAKVPSTARNGSRGAPQRVVTDIDVRMPRGRR